MKQTKIRKKAQGMVTKRLQLQLDTARSLIEIEDNKARKLKNASKYYQATTRTKRTQRKNEQRTTRPPQS